MLYYYFWKPDLQVMNIIQYNKTIVDNHQLSIKLYTN